MHISDYDVKTSFQLATNLFVQNNYEDALVVIDGIEKKYRNIPELYLFKSKIYFKIGKIEESLKFKELAKIYALLELEKLNNNNPEILSNLGVYYSRAGFVRKAIDYYEKALKINPSSLLANEGFLFAYAYDGEKSLQNYFDKARKWELRVVSNEIRKMAKIKKFKRGSLNGRRMKIGYVSGDFKNHAISYFIKNIFKNHDKDKFDVTVYSNNDFNDHVTDELKYNVEKWVDISELNDLNAAAIIEKDCQDVLIDLSGHTGRNRLKIFAHRVAPIQAHYLGYFATTGLTEMDYWIADPILAPDTLDAYFSEKIWRLPRGYCAYEPSNEFVNLSQNIEKNEFLKLGSFSGASKITSKCVVAWSEILKKRPQTILVLKDKAFDLYESINRIELMFLENGVLNSRLEFHGSSYSWKEHMMFYNDIDIALDPVGAHAGVTTTCDALWMGLPVITLAGDRVSQRQGASILVSFGKRDWIATSIEEYIDKNIELIDSCFLQRHDKQSQRNKMEMSDLCDSVNLTLELENAFISMFNRWCKCNNIDE